MNASEYDQGKLSAVRNPDGLFINVNAFREEAMQFIKNGYYCPDPFESPAWIDYWTEQRRRMLHGYSSGGVKITGDHYFYLNFCPIKRVEDTQSMITKKIVSFPDFWDGDYNYFWARELARYGAAGILHEDKRSQFYGLTDEQKVRVARQLFDKLQLELKVDDKNLQGGKNMIVGKSRRKGYSYKSGGIGAKNYYTKPMSLTIYTAYEKKYLYPGGLFTMSKNYTDFINANTGLAQPADKVNRQDHIKASYEETVDGVVVEKGFKSEMVAYTMKDNPDALRGKDAEDIFFEESGAFGSPGLLQSAYAASVDCVKAGPVKTGMITLFGTSGDMEGGTYDYADMFSRPAAFDLFAVQNIWDKGMEQTACGFFHPITWNMEGGFYDAQGNSDVAKATAFELDERKTLISHGATSVEISKRMQEKPLGPAEAFSGVSLNTFPVIELKTQLAKVKALGLQRKKGTPVNLKRMTHNTVKMIPITDGTEKPITSLHNLPIDQRGHFMVYEPPVPDAPPGMYKIGYDPIRQEQGSSLAGLVVYKSPHKNSVYKDCIVAEYIGRLPTPDDIDQLVLDISDLYNTKVMHENEVIGVKSFFRRKKRLNRLAAQPDGVISKNIKKSRVKRIFGCHMNTQLKSAGERYIKQWLLTVLDYDEDGKPVTPIDFIFSQRLLEELINYNNKGNFDLVSALMMCLFQVQEEELGKEYDEKSQHQNGKDLLDMMESMYK